VAEITGMTFRRYGIRPVDFKAFAVLVRTAA